ncbi:hypothetical protein VITFI_CDS1508 [Vitreoscilla filiformis]|uniref:Mor transcription activator domain-containing protein n=1 Tax=Vitreoscilla filiformis TaxID=63 RepID=A0A221KBK0_VITFI|nr:Mor transcription activator family protein [Vitreoscilla filiformis]ASM75791.1 hypothetical protein VITFI_CDS0012 [Vitreoscilla filiformis]ASM75915.1 hypothetical protein VITFI_CDS0136 [Vitreoscilla filiformis]ASM76411.1 hypothetical protein VITFI_CDS0632 [Vitreoscilla filiformis]ASM76865.1 hypothetical protein VITFI_CDS1087 [Vitreoscilla filiformis]ASM77286.1 hypothetical protein VITFI_CDS1508 [Vitreoscilla filiformis]
MTRKKPYLFIENLTAVAARVLTDRGMAPDTATTIGREIAVGMCNMYARTHLYIPAAIDLTKPLSARNRAILNAYSQPSPTARPFSSRRVEELAQEYGLTETYLYELLSDTMDAVRKEQGLPPMDERQGQFPL